MNGLEPTPLDLASGMVSGEHEPPWWPEGPVGTPRAELERAVREGLEHPPCLVSFSGGRDSSLVLAIAAAVARRDGLEPPVPFTVAFPGRPRSDEDEWQRRVVDHLGLDNWERVELHDELDLIGPVATAQMRRHGLLYPCNAHFHGPVLEAARGGTVLTGWGGDDLFANWPFGILLQPLRGRRRPLAGDFRRMAVWALPLPLRRRVTARFGMRDTFHWLTPPMRAQVLRDWAGEYAEEPRFWRRRMPWMLRRRYVAVIRHAFDLMAAGAGARIAHPLFDPGFAVALGRAYGQLGPSDRTTLMRDLSGDLLPEDVVSRRTKGWFGDVYVTDTSREFTRSFDGTGLDPELVDLDALRRVWQDDLGILATGNLVQQLWLAGDRGE